MKITKRITIDYNGHAWQRAKERIEGYFTMGDVLNAVRSAKYAYKKQDSLNVLCTINNGRYIVALMETADSMRVKTVIINEQTKGQKAKRDLFDVEFAS